MIENVGFYLFADVFKGGFENTNNVLVVLGDKDELISFVGRGVEDDWGGSVRYLVFSVRWRGGG